MSLRIFLYLLLVLAAALLTWLILPKDPFAELIRKEGNSFDFLISDAVVVDGSGEEPVLTDLLINGENIVYAGEVDSTKIEVKRAIDAAGRIVTPGFIDVHAHGNPMNNSFENFLAMGVTTVVLGQDGSHPQSQNPETPSIAAWLDQLEDYKPELNVAMLAGHASLRRQLGIQDTLPANEQQITAIGEALTEALQMGCFGISTGTEYVPGMYASQEELMVLAKINGSFDGIMMSHIRNEDDNAVDFSIAELIDLGRYCKIHVSHIKVVYGKGKERAEQILQEIDSARNRDIQITADVYPYLASYTGIGIVFPAWAKTRSQFENALEHRKEELTTFLQKRIMQRNGPEATLFGSGPYAGLTLAEASEQQGKDFTEILLELGPGGASGAYFIMDADLQDVFILDPEIMISTDGSPTMYHPRGYGTYARIIEKYVVKEKQMSIEMAVKKMTSLPAKTIGIPDRGLIKVGYKADLVIFDPYAVKEKAGYSDPHQLADGFDLVIVNGKIARERGRKAEKRNGKVLRKI